MGQDPINQRLKILVEALGMNVRSFSNKLGISDSTTRNYVDRGSKPPAEFIATVISSIESVNPKWLLLGQGDMFITDPSVTQSTTITANKNRGNIQNNGGTNNTVTNHVTLEDCKRNLEASQKENELLRVQLATKDALLAAKDDLIAAKEEMLSLLRAGHNRPN